MIDTRNLHVIKASAGSGKTFTLAKLYIERLLWDAQGNLRHADSFYHRHILAITFTNKATAEMKERIVARLQELSEGTCTDYEGDFLKAHPSTSAQELQQAAKAALANLLFDFTQFNVSTIDSFFQTVLRHFVFELDCEYDYELLLEEDDAMRQSVFSLLQTMSLSSKSDRLLQWVKKFVLENVRTQSDWNFFGSNGMDQLVKFANTLRREEFMAYHSALQEYVSDFGSGKSRLNQFVEQIAAFVKKKEEEKEAIESEMKDFICAFNVADLKHTLKNIHTGDPISGKIDTIKKWVEDSDKIKSQFTAAYVKAHGMPDVTPLLDSMKKYLPIINEIDVAKKVMANIWKLGFLGKISENLDQYRKDNGVILLTDTADLIHKVLESGVPFLYERMGVWLHHFMIDEFQDTSQKQYRNFKPLLENSLANAHFNLIIGDEKQSIYRFRNSDPDLLLTQLNADFPQQYNGSLNLTTNWRSAKNIVEFNNQFFQYVVGQFSAYDKLQATYSKLFQQYPAKSNPQEEAKRNKGFIRINWVPSKKEKSGNAEGENNGNNDVLSQLPAYILRLHHELNYPFGKILILVNTHKDGDQVVDALLNHNHTHPDDIINIVSAESMLLKNSPAVRMIVSVLNFINSTQYSALLADKLTESEPTHASVGKPKIAKDLADQFYYKILHEMGKALADNPNMEDVGCLLETVFRNNDDFLRLSKHEQISQFAEQFKALIPNPHDEQIGLVGLVDRIILHYVEPLGLNQGAETTFLQTFQGVVLDFCNQRSNIPTIYDFLRFWEQKKEKLTVASAGTDDAVEVMTIHAAKGLERECVILPFANWELEKGGDDLCWVPKEHWMGTSPESKPFLGVPANGDDSIVPPLIPIPYNLIKECSRFQEYLAPIKEDDLIDCLNKTYVAFTRPRNALHIFAKQPSDKDTSLNSLLSNYFEQGDHGTPIPNEQNQNEVIGYTIGEELPYTPKEDEKESSQEELLMPVYTVHPIGDRLKIKMEQVVSQSQDIGKRMHRIVSKIHYAGDVDKAMRYAKKRRLLGKSDEPYWNTERADAFLHRLVTDAATAPWFAPGNVVYNERPIFTPATAASSASTLRPDRIVRTPDGRALVIDYKFGDAPSKSQKAAYEKQVATYCRHLTRLWHTPVEGYILYAKSFTIREIRD
ncbi:MAG: UvrD-helicase domain-containing protein [Sodaliphilus sp.]